MSTIIVLTSVGLSTSLPFQSTQRAWKKDHWPTLDLADEDLVKWTGCSCDNEVDQKLLSLPCWYYCKNPAIARPRVSHQGFDEAAIPVLGARPLLPKGVVLPKYFQIGEDTVLKYQDYTK